MRTLKVSLVIIFSLVLGVAFQNCGRVTSLNDSTQSDSSLNISSTSNPIPVVVSSPQADIPTINSGGIEECGQGASKIEALFLKLVDYQGVPAIPITSTRFSVSSGLEYAVYSSFVIIEESTGTIAIPMLLGDGQYKIKVGGQAYLIVIGSVKWGSLCDGERSGVD